MICSKESLQQVLREKDLEIEFIKQNGELRKMECTLREDALPSNERTKTEKPNDEIITVWALDVNDWRTIRIDSIFTIGGMPVDNSEDAA